MKILFVSRFYFPHLGGVEKHIEEVSRELVKRGHEITVITARYDEKLPYRGELKGVRVIRFDFPNLRFLGLLKIWLWGLRNIYIFRSADVVHIHDVFVWVMPLRVLLPFKKFFLTMHGWEGSYPIHYKNVILKKLSAYLSNGSIVVGSYIKKWYGVESDFVTYGAVKLPKSVPLKKKKDSLIYLGRLEKDTGLINLLLWLRKHKKLNVVFCGDGSLRDKCEEYGKVLGWYDPSRILAKFEYCAAGGYLSALEAIGYKCKLILFWDNPLKKDYWQLSPFSKYYINHDTTAAYKWAKQKTWANLSGVYLKLWRKR